MKREYGFVLIVYIAMQLSSLIGVPLLAIGLSRGGRALEVVQADAMNYWILISFISALLLILFILRKEMGESLQRMRGEDARQALLWGIGGIFLAYFAQILAASIEQMLGIKPGSENTQEIMKMIYGFPAVMFVTSIVGPILEEIVFRKIIFGSLHRRFNFFISALLSSLIFAAAHMEFEHILLYSAMGFTFAFLYVKTGRIIVPIFAHVAMNTIVVIIQFIFKEEIEKIMQEAEKMQNFIGGFL
ncbi:abortive infection protein [Bacillus sp. FJAT-27225]|uniref:CPBP family intramembrane glutamic endopeptidase n=1 Tax=Bacillus sp. FJAT-27225 TaxID=1743144 RepID=UPI00080C33A0|nr:type II CAAX endopeptidase family protein [Bacillus sp. FJAT-27225]OCA88698.1 abortive infection protein [Bacillus sp. FJAT-27225]